MPVNAVANAVETRAESALANTTRLLLSRLPQRGMISFQVYRQAPNAFETLRLALGFEPPSSPNSATSGDGVHCLWTTPHRWFIDCGLARSQLLLAALTARADTEATLFRTTACSDSFESFVLEGDNAVRVLAKGCAIDLRCPATAPGAALRTRFADVPLMVHKVAPAKFRLHVDVSLSHYLWAWLTDASSEFEQRETQR